MPTDYIQRAKELGELLTKKNAAYGNSFAVSQKFLELLYPNGVQVKDYLNMLSLARIFDKMMRIATDQDAFGEDPYNDIAGYAILMSEHRQTRDLERKVIKCVPVQGPALVHARCVSPGLCECECSACLTQHKNKDTQ